MCCFSATRPTEVSKSTELKYFMHMRFVNHSKSSPYRVCIFAFGLSDKLKNNKFSSFSYFAKKVSDQDIFCVPFSESTCNTENNDTKYDDKFRILSIRKTS